MRELFQKINNTILSDVFISKITGRYFITFWSLVLVLTVELALKYLSQEIYKDIIIALIIAFYGGGVLSNLSKGHNT